MADSKRSKRQRSPPKLVAVQAQLRQERAQRERLQKRHRAAERGLREVRERFDSAFNSAPIGMGPNDMDGRWLQVNDALCRITGHTQDELKATTLPAITHPEDVALDAQELRQLVAGGIPSYQTEKRYRHAWGHYVWVHSTVSLVRDASSGALHTIMQVQTSPSGRSCPNASSTWSITIS